MVWCVKYLENIRLQMCRMSEISGSSTQHIFVSCIVREAEIRIEWR